jgi:hypothetical protein
MKTTMISLMAAVTVAFLAGCATNESQGEASGNGGQAMLLFHKPSRPYTEMGSVSTPKVQPDHADSWQNVLKRQAGTMGADAVIVDTSTLNNVDTPVVIGTAIKYNAQPQSQ